MCLKWKKYFCYLVVTGLCFNYKTAVALEFEAGVSGALEYTDNVTLSSGVSSPIVDELIAITAVSASLSEADGPLTYSSAATFSKNNYTKDTYDDQFNLEFSGIANWQAIRNRLNFTVSDNFYQRSINSLDASTPDNTQDSNVFLVSADILFPISARQGFSIVPSYRKYYYERAGSLSNTNNSQYALAARWNYQIYRLTNVGLSASTRVVDYESENNGFDLPDTTFNDLSLVINGTRVNSNYTIDLGTTYVHRAGAEGASGLRGGAPWTLHVSSRSTFDLTARTEITDTSSASTNLIGNGDDVQQVADVIRNTVFNVTYGRNDADLHSDLWVEYREIKYDIAESLDYIVRTTGARLSFPGTPLYSSSIGARYRQSERVNTDRTDDSFIVDGGFSYSLSRALKSVFSLQYSTKESNDPTQNYNELSVFVSLSYGYGGASRSFRGDSF